MYSVREKLLILKTFSSMVRAEIRKGEKEKSGVALFSIVETQYILYIKSKLNEKSACMRMRILLC